LSLDSEYKPTKPAPPDEEKSVGLKKEAAIHKKAKIHNENICKVFNLIDDLRTGNNEKTKTMKVPRYPICITNAGNWSS